MTQQQAVQHNHQPRPTPHALARALERARKAERREAKARQEAYRQLAAEDAQYEQQVAS